MASEVSIANSALQKLGAARIISLTEDSRNARSINACYEELRDAELRAHPWNFARKRITLAPDVAVPDHDFSYQFTLPTDCLKPLPPARTYLDWQVENGKILTNDGTSIQLKYVSRETDPNKMDVLFREMLACRIAVNVAYEITQSLSLVEEINGQYKLAKAEAKRSNAFEQSSDELPEDGWVASRL